MRAGVFIDGLSEDMNRVLTCVVNAEDPVTAAEVSDLTGIAPVTVRVYLRRLDERGHVTRPYRGQYLAKEQA